MKQEVEGFCCPSFVFHLHKVMSLLQEADTSVQVHLCLMVSLGPERHLAW